MRTRFSGAIVTATALAASTVFPTISGQAPAAPARTGQSAAAPQRAARIAGHPNLNGIYQAIGSQFWNLEDHPAQATAFWQLGAIGAIPAGTSVVEGGSIPYKPAALKQRDENRAGWPKSDPEAKCYMPGIPRANYMPYPFQIVQGQNDILFVYEFATASRIVHMSNHQEAPLDSWMGWANGAWQGDTLVIENSAFNDQTWFDRAGNFHSNALKVTERFTRVGENLQYEATIDDPDTFTRPWTIRMPLYGRVEKNPQLLEFKCVEFSEELLYGDLRKKSH
jgi:hypothetical protein